MKKCYEKPFAEVAPFASQLMQGVDEPENSGEAWNPKGKEVTDIVEDDDETSFVEKEAEPLAISNDFLKKVWD